MPAKTITFNYTEYQSDQDLNQQDKELVIAARHATANASPQFSNFAVGAAARLTDGTIHVSSNKENTSIITCAEQNLLLHLHSFIPNFTIESLAVSFHNLNPNTTSDFPITPCGKCRQLILEAEDNSGSPIKIIMTGQSGKVLVANSAVSLLPLAYTKEMLQNN